jgi:5-deoxy-glucuronate isomerase
MLLTPAADGAVTPLLDVTDDGRIGVARTRGSVSGRCNGTTAWVLVEGGDGRLRVGDETVEVRGRHDVFEEAGWSAAVAPGDDFSLEGSLRATVVWRTETRPARSRLIPPEVVEDEQRGEGTTLRRVRTYIPSGPLIVGETLNPPGLWSSYPPHRHEHEEIYLYRFDPPGGFGLQMRSESDDDERAVVVRDGRIERITSGWHPVVAAPGAQLYYLWALAGASDSLETEVDPRYAGPPSNC